jgi:hypothetical protein
MKLKPLIFIAGAAGAIAAVAKRRPQAVQSVAKAAPEPVKQAASTAAQTVQRAVETVTPGGNDQEETQVHERYEPPIEAGAQEPTEPGGSPSDEPAVAPPEPMISQPGGGLNEPEHPLPEGAVMPDTSDDDPLVRAEEKAAAGDAGSIGGNINSRAADDESLPRDPADIPVAEGSGDEDFENFETREDVERSNREMEP